MKKPKAKKRGNPYMWPYTEEERAEARKSFKELKGEPMDTREAEDKLMTECRTNLFMSSPEIKETHEFGVMRDLVELVDAKNEALESIFKRTKKRSVKIAESSWFIGEKSQVLQDKHKIAKAISSITFEEVSK